MTKRHVLLTLGWILVLTIAATGIWQAWVDEAEPPIGACVFLVPAIGGAIGLAAITVATRRRNEK